MAAARGVGLCESARKDIGGESGQMPKHWGRMKEGGINLGQERRREENNRIEGGKAEKREGGLD